MDRPDSALLHYYSTPGPLTELHEHSSWVADLPREIPALCAVVQTLLIHQTEAHRYRVRPSPARRREMGIRPATAMIGLIRALDPRLPTVARSPDRRLLVNCRGFAVLLTALLRHQGVPARARCGFATYFGGPLYADHWITEYWDEPAGRWVQVDSQLDAIQREAYALDFDPNNVPGDRFLVAGRAWQQCRTGASDPRRFGLGARHGLGYIRDNLLRDLAALNQQEPLADDRWGAMAAHGPRVPARDMAALDAIATCTAEQVAWPAVQTLYASDPDLQAPAASRPAGRTASGTTGLDPQGWLPAVVPRQQVHRRRPQR